MIVACDRTGVKLAVSIIKNGGLVVFPTDTVYGLGCDPHNSKAVKNIFRIKKRIESKELPLLGFSKNEISKIAIFDESSNKLADRFWPGALTLVLKIKNKSMKKTMNLGEKVAVRVPNHPCTLSLLKECRVLVGTSANFSGSPSFSDSKKVLENFSGFDILIDMGTIENSGESTIVEMDDGNLKILRQGKIAESELIAAL